ncbi:hypothetical protein MHH49_19435 [Paenibacillus sp. FSL F4-0122]|uniref:hypothetical protein n=1 Tax=Paenibacillus sp. FSL F4-0122 TaxID=2921371 RepID=UPI0030F8E16B
MKLITLVLGPFDPGEFETIPAFLVDHDRAIFVFEGALWAQVVRKSAAQEGFYESNNGDDSVMIADDVSGTTDEVVPPLVERWQAMTALDFIVRDMVGAVCDELGLTI